MKRFITSMKRLVVCFYILAAFCTISFTANAQALDSKGTDFWLTFPGNYNGGAQLSLFISGDQNTSGTVTIPGLGFSAPFTVTVGTVTTVSLPTNADLGATSSTVTNKGIHVVSGQEVTIYGLSRIQATTDAYLALPTDILGTEYINLGYKNVNIVNGTQLGIVASQNATIVTISPTITTDGHTAGVPYNVTLNQGETYQLRNTGPEPNDLSGTIVSSNKPIAVFGGHQCANIPNGSTFACDFIVEQLPPVTAWGKNFITVPLKTRIGGDSFRFLAAENGTTVNVDGVVVASLNRGQFHERILTAASQITSNKPILVAQYSNGTTFDNVTSDPFMMLITPYEQFLGNYTFATPASGFRFNFVNVVAPAASVGALRLDGITIPSSSFTAVGSTGFSRAQLDLTLGAHTINGTNLPFGIFVYGFDNADSYGYPGGQSLAPIASVTSLVLTPKTGAAQVGTVQCFDALVKDQFNNPVVGVRVDFNITGANPGSTGFVNTNGSGIAHFCYTGINTGTDNIVASVGTISDAATFMWTPAVSDVYYSKSSGDLHNVLTWGLNPDGSGANPSDFGDSIFQLANRPNVYTMTADWSVGGTINIPSASQLQINGNTLSIVSLAGAGTLTGSLTSNLNVGGTAGTNVNLNFTTGNGLLNNLTLNRTGSSAAATIGTPLAIYSVLTLSSGALNTSGLLTLKSTAANTARVAPVTGSIDGNVTVERYIPARRAWRILSAPVGGTSGASNGQATLTHSQEPGAGPLTTSMGDPRPLSFGTATFSLNAAHTAMTFTATITNIDVTGTQTADANDNLTAAHIHVGALPGANAPVRWGFFGAPLNDNNPSQLVFTPFATGVGGTFSSTWDLPEGNAGTTLATNLPGILAGQSYINFHTTQFGGGEIRGQISFVGAGTQTINQAWQEGAILGLSANPNPVPGYGTHITGGAIFGSTTNGFDQNPGAKSSIKKYNSSIDNWEALPNTIATSVSAEAYMTFIRGNRGLAIGDNTVPPTTTTLRAMGPLKVGDQVFPVAGTGFTAIPNPFASPINFATITKINVSPNFYLWDPKMGGAFGVGAYVLLSDNGMGGYDVVPASVSPESQYIQSGQGFLVSPLVPGVTGSLTIKESDKSPTAATDVFRVNGGANTSATSAPKFENPKSGQGLRISLLAVNADRTNSLLDEVFTSYGTNYSNKIDKMDAEKLSNEEENLGIIREGKTLMLERKVLPAEEDVIALKLWNTNPKEYLFEVNPIGLSVSEVSALLEDKYLKTSTPIKLDAVSQISFNVTSNAASARPDRFQIILNSKKGVSDVLTNLSNKSILTAFPNPINGRIINLSFGNKVAGVYQVSLVNSAGQVVFKKNIQHGGGTATQSLLLDKKLSQGFYQLQILGKEGTTNIPIISN